MNTYIENLVAVKVLLGSWDAVGKSCGDLSGKAVIKWRNKGRPPRTEYSGETDYASMLAKASNGRFDRDAFLPVNVRNN